MIGILLNSSQLIRWNQPLGKLRCPACCNWESCCKSKLCVRCTLPCDRICPTCPNPIRNLAKKGKTLTKAKFDEWLKNTLWCITISIHFRKYPNYRKSLLLCSYCWMFVLCSRNGNRWVLPTKSGNKWLSKRWTYLCLYLAIKTDIFMLS